MKYPTARRLVFKLKGTTGSRRNRPMNLTGTLGYLTPSYYHPTGMVLVKWELFRDVSASSGFSRFLNLRVLKNSVSQSSLSWTAVKEYVPLVQLPTLQNDWNVIIVVSESSDTNSTGQIQAIYLRLRGWSQI
jgi:hypothetical protein